MRRTHYLVVILLLIAQTSFGQIYQNMAQPGYKFSRARFDSVLTIPMGLGGLRNISGGQDTGQIRFNLSDSSVYVWNGRAWIKPIGGGVSDTLKVSVSDTAAMLSAYARSAAVTSSLATKLNITDTATMLAPYSRVGVSSYGKNATADSTILLLSNGTRFAAKDSVGGGGASGWSLAGNASSVTDFLGTTNNRTMRFRTNNVERMVIDSTGRVGIGTSAPAFGLDVNGTARISGATSFLGSYTPPLLIGGTTSSGFFLNRRLLSNTVEGTSFRDTLAATANGFNLTGVRITPTFVTGTFTGGTSNALLVSGGNTSLTTLTASSVTSSGVVQAINSGIILGQFGIPGAEFGNNVILGREAASGDRIPNSTINDAFIRTNVSAGIVIGDGTIGVKAKFFNSGSLMLKVGGTYNEIASAALNVESTTKGLLIPRMTTTQRNAIASPATGLQVIVTGETGGEFLSIYNSSTATWQRGLLSTSSAIGSVFVGQNAGSGASDATNSNFIGSSAGLNASAASSNFFGQNAGSGATSAGSSNFFGTNAGFNASAASSSNFFGSGSGVSATNAFGSNIFGSDAGNGATNANASNFFGNTAGFGATGANNSNFFGFRAGRNATGASHSNFFGFNVGNSTTHTITGTNNIIIGTNITTPTAASTNTANIGGVLYLTGTYGTTTGNPRALAQTAGKVGINTTTPVASAALEIVSTTAGVLFPRMTNAQKLAIASPTDGLVVYDTTLNKLCVYTTTWETITSL